MVEFGAKFLDAAPGIKQFRQRRQIEGQTSGPPREWQDIAREFRTTNIGALVAAERTFSITLLNRLTDRSQAALPLGSTQHVVTSDYDSGQRMSTLSPELQRTAQQHHARGLIAEYRAYQSGQADRSGDQRVPESIGEETAAELNRERTRIFNEIAGLSSDVEIAEYDKKTVKAQRKLRRKLPGAQEMMDQVLPSAKEIEKALPESKKEIAEMEFNATLVDALLRDTHRNGNIENGLESSRQEDAVFEDLHGLITQYDSIKAEGTEPPRGTPEAAYYQRVKRLEHELDQKRDNIYRRAALTPDNEIAEFQQGAESAVRILSHRRLHGAQRELLARRTGLTVTDIEDAYHEAFRKNRNNIFKENGLAVFAGAATAVILRQFPHLSGTALASASGISETAQDVAMVVGGSAIAKLIVETGQSISVLGSAFHDFVKARTDNIFLRKVAANAGQSATQTFIEKGVWGGALTVAAFAGLSVRDALGVVIGANGLGITWQAYLALQARHERRRLIRKGREKASERRRAEQEAASSDATPVIDLQQGKVRNVASFADGRHDALPDRDSLVENS